MSAITKEVRLQGEAISRGVAIGSIFYHRLAQPLVTNEPVADIEQEIARFWRAITQSRTDLTKLVDSLRVHRAVEAVDILEAHLLLLKDPVFTTEVERLVRETKGSAAYIFFNTVKEYERRFKALDDPFFRERFNDLDDVSRRVLSHILPRERRSLSAAPPESIVYAEELLASEAAEVHGCHVSAFVTHRGGASSHAAIVAKAKGIPYVTQLELPSYAKREPIEKIIVDGRVGVVILNPGLETLAHYQNLQKSQEKHMLGMLPQAALQTQTSDGQRVGLSANVEVGTDLESLKAYPGVGIGLYRSEYLFLAGNRVPDEEYQYQAYKKLVEMLPGRSVVIRAFDIGGDKYLLREGRWREGNPYLGYRAIRFLLREPLLFRTQLRAIWRAAIHGNVRVLFPMISGLQELREAKRMTEEVRQELLCEGVPIAETLPIGCMIEVPSAAVSADLLASECDFFSIGTNDLVQYSLAVDRTSQAMRGHYTATHPGILRMIHMVAVEARRRKIPVSLCGEMAADPRFTMLLLGLGVNDLSVAPKFIPVIKNVIHCVSMKEAEGLAQAALKLPTAEEVLAFLDEDYRCRMPNDFFYSAADVKPAEVIY